MAMNHGPVLSRTYDLIAGAERSPHDWNKSKRPR